MFLTEILVLVTGESSEPFSTWVNKRTSRAGAALASIAVAAPASATRSSFACWAKVEKENATITVASNTSRLMPHPPKLFIYYAAAYAKPQSLPAAGKHKPDCGHFASRDKA